LKGLLFFGLVFLFGHEMIKTSIFSDKIEPERSGLISWVDMPIEDGLSDGFTSQIFDLLANFGVESEYLFVFVREWDKVHFHFHSIVIAFVTVV
jgi:hypothetical protein